MVECSLSVGDLTRIATVPGGMTAESTSVCEKDATCFPRLSQQNINIQQIKPSAQLVAGQKSVAPQKKCENAHGNPPKNKGNPALSSNVDSPASLIDVNSTIVPHSFSATGNSNTSQKQDGVEFCSSIARTVFDYRLCADDQAETVDIVDPSQNNNRSGTSRISSCHSYRTTLSQRERLQLPKHEYEIEVERLKLEMELKFVRNFYKLH